MDYFQCSVCNKLRYGMVELNRTLCRNFAHCLLCKGHKADKVWAGLSTVKFCEQVQSFSILCSYPTKSHWTNFGQKSGQRLDKVWTYVSRVWTWCPTIHRTPAHKSLLNSENWTNFIPQLVDWTKFNWSIVISPKQLHFKQL